MLLGGHAERLDKRECDRFAMILFLGVLLDLKQQKVFKYVSNNLNKKKAIFYGLICQLA